VDDGLDELDDLAPVDLAVQARVPDGEHVYAVAEERPVNTLAWLVGAALATLGCIFLWSVLAFLARQR
jgi:hypothetical protein